MYKTWVITAESSQARFFTVPSKKEPLVQIQELLNPASKIHESELTSDLPGRTSTSGPNGNKHAKEPQVSPKEQATITFAKKIAEKVEKARGQGELEQLILVSPPKFLGLLRDNLSDQAKKMVIQSLDKNLVGQNEANIRKHLF
ncbi:host attachment protein [Methylomarinum sp. Ch1-1]|uniref:Host attachment protein n=1 Tax=Methylomarinum roseum TaxID=3067653 RepID=A0AAU7NRI5_9GAMM|nr:host attachment protein [Methylomarinum sp. Ch1-1]MDP4520457.1 host attachment protein [Methylomarinum sp. Ch1-1]